MITLSLIILNITFFENMLIKAFIAAYYPGITPSSCAFHLESLAKAAPENLPLSHALFFSFIELFRNLVLKEFFEFKEAVETTEIE